uniref:Uncharacterized protein n=1 Tax=Nelumbo nucifera TaxID=4432 RepID=A0A823A0P9_NELNU|nr:TPA_asm: hypothetical protein HUJ06_018826 [Nelumbo nucifera]
MAPSAVNCFSSPPWATLVGSYSLKYDVEQPPILFDDSSSNKVVGPLTEKMLHLNHPNVIASMTLAVSDVAQA